MYAFYQGFDFEFNIESTTWQCLKSNMRILLA